MTRNVLNFLLGAVVGLLVAIPIIERQARWENRTLACWPTKDDPTPVRHP